MPNCHEMKKGDVYACPACGLELAVIRECDEAGTPSAGCAHHDEANACTFRCCGHDLERRRSAAA